MRKLLLVALMLVAASAVAMDPRLITIGEVDASAADTTVAVLVPWGGVMNIVATDTSDTTGTTYDESSGVLVQGSLDGVAWVSLGSAFTAGSTAITVDEPWLYLRLAQGTGDGTEFHKLTVKAYTVLE